MPVAADDGGGAAGVSDPPTATLESGRRLELFPGGSLFTPFIADPHRPVFAIEGQVYADDSVADSGSSRVGLKTGGRFGMLRLTSADGSRRWQLSIEAGLDAQFDTEYSLDAIGWDGNYGLSLTTVDGGPVAWKLGVIHTSSHVGDEYAERTGRKRIGYTREEITGAVAWRRPGGWRAYLEVGWAYKNSADVQEPGRGQVGVELERPGSLWGGRMGWYLALDVQAMEERDWSTDAGLHAGFSFDRSDRRWRLGLAAYDGRVPLGEFYQDDESHVAFGIWMDV